MKKFLAAAIIALGLIASGTGIADAAELRGNPNSKVYHNKKCKHYSAKRVTVKFRSEQEAAKKGYKPCKTCMIPNAKHGLIGNTKTRVFHKPNCKHASKNHVVVLKTPQEAKKKGYKPCNLCNSWK